MTERKETCSTCRWWDGDRQDCRVNPPTVVAIDNDEYTVWPDTDPDDWCGAWQDKQEPNMAPDRLPPE